MENLIHDDDRQDFKKSLTTIKNDIDILKEDMIEISNYDIKIVSQEHDMNIQSDNLSRTDISALSNLVLSDKKNHIQPVVNISKDGSTLSHLLLRQISPAILDLDQLDLDQIETFSDEEVTVDIDSNTPPRAGNKIRLSNNIVDYPKDPFKAMVDGAMQVIETCVEDVPASETVVETVEQGLTRQKQTTNNSIKPAFANITSDWAVEGENSDRGFSSVSICRRDPEGQRVLAKIQDHLLAAANEWLAYTLEKLLGLPINEAQIGIHQNNLVTLEF